MSDHLLECPSSNTCECNMGPVHKDSCPQRKKCICTELRACEQRVAAETISRLDRWQQHSPLGRKTYEDGLDAARDAVAEAVANRGGYHSAAEFTDCALAAIDNLITKNSGENYE